MAWTADDVANGKVDKTNFTWGSGADAGNTNGWSNQQWADYHNQWNPQKTDAAPADPSASGKPPDAGFTPAAPTDLKSDLKTQLFNRMHQGLNVDPNDPIIKNQMTAFNAQQDRQTQQSMDQSAEQAAAHGLGNSGALANENRLTQENAGFNSANMQSQLMSRELASRREEVSNALQSMSGILSEEEKNSLTKEMHDIDAAIERDKTTNQNSQYYAGLSSQERQLASRLSQEWALGQQGNQLDWARLAQGDNQWADKMGFDTADQQAHWDAVRRGY
jgi:hypothetical protein